jgi:GDP-4-dehydro-6-deoxy-D-mannose reductase
VKVLVTGADGFVGTWLVRRLLRDGHEVVGGVRPTDAPPSRLSRSEHAAVQWVPLELTAPDSVRRVAGPGYDAVAHLAAVASGVDATGDPGYAWVVNAAGTARLVDALLEARGRPDPVVLVVSTGEVYGAGPAPRRETDPVAPCSPYAASKLGAEIAALETWRRRGLRVVVARAFAHTGPGQDGRFVVPAFAQRLRAAKRAGLPVIRVGNLEPVREFLHVEDVVDAYARLLEQGKAGEVYNVASGAGISLDTLLARLAALVGVEPVAEIDPSLVRAADIPCLVGDATKLRSATGWAPRHSLEETLKEVVDAQTD